jgi:hypothetical protein
MDTVSALSLVYCLVSTTFIDLVVAVVDLLPIMDHIKDQSGRGGQRYYYHISFFAFVVFPHPSSHMIMSDFKLT